MATYLASRSPLTRDDGADVASIDPKHRGDGRLPNASGSHRSNCDNRLVIEFVRMAKLLRHVSHINDVFCGKEVGRVAARRIVALMADVQGCRTVRQCPCDAMRADRLTIDFDATVASTGHTGPQPAFVGTRTLHTRPEPFGKRLAANDVHSRIGVSLQIFGGFASDASEGPMRSSVGLGRKPASTSAQSFHFGSIARSTR